MKVFVGWSGERSKALAQALHQWMPLVLHYVQPWLSEEDIAAGERWVQAVAKELEASNFGVLCLTRENISSPWIIFEAGSLAKSLQGRVTPLLLDLEFREVGGPLAQFQSKKADKDGLGDLIQSVNQAAAQPIQEGRAKQLYDALWPQLESQLASIPKQPGTAKPVRSQHEVLEELVSGVRSLEGNFKDLAGMVSDVPRFARSRRLGRVHPFIVHELPHVISEGPDDPTSILVFASLFREEIPWLYELGMEAYRASRQGPPEEAERALRRFARATEMMVRGPFTEEFGIDPRTVHMVFRELERFVTREKPGEEEQPRSKRKKGDDHV